MTDSKSSNTRSGVLSITFSVHSEPGIKVCTYSGPTRILAPAFFAICILLIIRSVFPSKSNAHWLRLQVATVIKCAMFCGGVVVDVRMNRWSGLKLFGGGWFLALALLRKGGGSLTHMRGGPEE